MDLTAVDLTKFRILAEALAIGLLVGIERYKGRAPGEKRAAGVRTFAILSLLGALSGLAGHIGVPLATFGAVAAMLAIGYYRETETSVGLTTEIAALIVFWLGYLLHSFEILAISTSIVLTIMLASKQALHDFVRQTMSETELFDTLKFLAVVLVVYPLLPDRAMGPFDFFNPARAWLLVVLVSAVGYGGYLLMRWLGTRRGLMISGLAGGLVSTTATTLSLAGRAKEAPESSARLGVVAVTANVAQFPRLLVLLLAVDRPFASYMAAPLVAMGAVGALGAWLLFRARSRGNDSELKINFRNPFSLTPALKFGAFFVGLLFAVKVAEAWLGNRGVLIASALGGIGSVSAVALSIAELTIGGSLGLAAGATAVLVGITVNALTKWVLALLYGTRQLSLWLGGGLLTMVVAGFAALYLLGPLASLFSR